jgi:multidrug resistance efflux pump
LALQQATLDLQMVQADYDRLVTGPRRIDLAPLRAGIHSALAQMELAEAQVAQAETQTAQAQTQVSQAEAAVIQAEAGLEAAKAQTAQAQAALDRVKAGPIPEEVAVAEAAVAQAREAQGTSQALLDQTRLTAPFDGTVGLVHVREGEEVLPGQAVLVLGDTSTLRVETTDLDEIDVAIIHPGQQADLTFDALPERVIGGIVQSVAPMATQGQGAVTYRVVIDFEETDPAMRWGMTTFVDIITE